MGDGVTGYTSCCDCVHWSPDDEEGEHGGTCEHPMNYVGRHHTMAWQGCEAGRREEEEEES